MFSFLRRQGSSTASAPGAEGKYALVALGDSILSDCYPGPAQGAASLVFQNIDHKFSEFRGRDLKHRFPDGQFLNLTRSGFVLNDVLQSCTNIPNRAQVQVLLLSVGGNDVLGGLLGSEAAWADWHQQFLSLVMGLRQRFGSKTLVCSLYDPTDGTGVLPSAIASGTSPQTAPLVLKKLALLERMNLLLRDVAHQADSGYVDIYRHFLGHGSSRLDQNGRALEGYWFQRDIEPSSTGASETRRVILQCLESLA